MREKKQQCVVTFKTTTQAMSFEEVAKQGGLEGRLIPLPRQIGAGCGLAWRENPEKETIMRALMENHNLAYDQIHHVII